MTLETLLENAYPAQDYLVVDGGAWIVALMTPEEYASATAGNTGPYTVTDPDTNTVYYLQLMMRLTNEFMPLTSLVDGARYESAPDTQSVDLVSFVSSEQVNALNDWLQHHSPAIDAAKNALISKDVAMATAIFDNNLNGLKQLLTDMNADWALGEDAETVPTDTIPGSTITFLELSAKVELYSTLGIFLNTPMAMSAMTPMELLTKSK